jgi:hypothetical protein
MERNMDPKERLRRRAIVLTGHAEEMAALIRFHVLECARCKANVCAEGMPGLLDRLDTKLRELCGELKQQDDSAGE